MVGDLVHLGAAPGWVGGLVLLALGLHHRRDEEDTSGAAAVVARLSTFAATSVLALFASGIAMALLVAALLVGLATPG